MIVRNCGLGATCLRTDATGRYTIPSTFGMPSPPPEAFKPGWFAVCQPTAGSVPDPVCLEAVSANQMACLTGSPAGASLPDPPVEPKPTGNAVQDSINQAMYNLARIKYSRLVSGGDNAAVNKTPAQTYKMSSNSSQSGGSSSSGDANVGGATGNSMNFPSLFTGTINIMGHDIPIWLLGVGVIGSIFFISSGTWRRR